MAKIFLSIPINYFSNLLDRTVSQIGVLTCLRSVIYLLSRGHSNCNLAQELATLLGNALQWDVLQSAHRDGRSSRGGGKKIKMLPALCGGNHSDTCVRHLTIVSINSRNRRVNSRIPLELSGQFTGRGRNILSLPGSAYRKLFEAGTRVGNCRGNHLRLAREVPVFVFKLTSYIPVSR